MKLFENVKNMEVSHSVSHTARHCMRQGYCAAKYLPTQVPKYHLDCHHSLLSLVENWNHSF